MGTERLRRNEPDRTGPVRNRVVRRPNWVVHEGGTGSQAGPDPSDRDGLLERSVETAYTVIERYMSRGQTAARMHYGPNGGPSMNDPNGSRQGNPWEGASRGPYQPGPGGPSSPWDPWNVGMWMAPWMQMVRMWTDGLSAMTPAAMAPWMPGVTPEPRDAAAGEIGVSVQVQSRRPARVTLKMDGSADARYVSVGPLSKPGQASETLTGVRLISRSDHCLVQVSVPDSQAPGVYVGTVEDRQRRTVGELSVSITGAAAGGDAAGADEAAEN